MTSEGLWQGGTDRGPVVRHHRAGSDLPAQTICWVWQGLGPTGAPLFNRLWAGRIERKWRAPTPSRKRSRPERPSQCHLSASLRSTAILAVPLDRRGGKQTQSSQSDSTSASFASRRFLGMGRWVAAPPRSDLASGFDSLLTHGAPLGTNAGASARRSGRGAFRLKADWVDVPGSGSARVSGS